MKNALIVCLALLFACTGYDKSKQNIVGKWSVQGSASLPAWEFASNGAATMGNTAGKYSFGDRNRLKDPDTLCDLRLRSGAHG